MRQYATHLRIFCILAGTCLLAQGCTEPNAEHYPKLHSVPDRPEELTPSSSVHKEVQTLEKSHDEKLLLNNVLRRRFGLEVASAIDDSDQNKTQ
ncbi:MAG: hypothetical protein ACTHJ4_05985 [Candidatus Nucleicultricaceae bacterium]